MHQGIFVSIEGCEGAGKSTQVRLLAEALTRAGHAVTLVREPGSTAIGEQVRRILLDPASAGMDPRCELLLYLASRAQLVSQVIRPALAKGEVVISDRFHHSTLAYQGEARGLGVERLREINLFATDRLLPDLTFLLDLPVELGMRRKQDPAGFDRIESEGGLFHQRVREAFLRLAREEAGRVVLLDGTLAVEELSRAIRERVETLLAQPQG